MSDRDDLAHLAASMHYAQGLTMEAIAARLEVSRSTISRLLTYARETGMVTITVQPPTNSRHSLGGQLKERFGVQAWVVPVRPVDPDLARLREVARVAAGHLGAAMAPATTLGIAWGNTTSAIIPFLTSQPLRDTTVVQLNGATNAQESGLGYADSILSQAADAFAASMVHFPVPAFFDYKETKEAMWRERSIRKVLKTIEKCDIALFGVGAVSGKLLSHVYAGGFLDHDEIEAARKDGVVGDVCTVLIRSDGSTDMALNARASGPSPAQLRQVPRRICAAAGDAKAAPLLGALRAGVVTDLVVDSSLAARVLAMS